MNDPTIPIYHPAGPFENRAKSVHAEACVSREGSRTIHIADAAPEDERLARAIMRRRVSTWIRKRLNLDQSPPSSMLGSRPTSTLTGEDLAGVVAQHRATAQAQLEGTIEPKIPTTDAAAANNATKKRQSGVKSGAKRESVRDSLQSYLAISAANHGYGHGLAMGFDVRNGEQDEHFVPARASIFHEDAFDQPRNNPYLSRHTTRRRNKFRYSMIDPSIGMGHSAAHHEAGEEYSEQASYIRAMVESGNFDMQHLHLTRESVADPDFRTALHSALENFPPEVTSRIIDAAVTQAANDSPEPELRHSVSPLKRARNSIQIVSKRVFPGSNRWSRVGSKRYTDIRVYEKPSITRRFWQRVSWSKPASSISIYG